MSTERIWHNLSVGDVIGSLNSGIRGLTREEAERRLAQFGPNELAEKKKISPFMLWLGQFRDFLIVILLVAVVLSTVLGEVTDAIVIFVIVLFATTLGFIQEYRAVRAMEALKRMAAPTSSVLRDGQEIEIAAREIVPGDIVSLRTGDKVPADSRLIEAVNLKAEEAPLTGESVPIEKTVAIIPGEDQASAIERIWPSWERQSFGAGAEPSSPVPVCRPNSELIEDAAYYSHGSEGASLRRSSVVEDKSGETRRRSSPAR